MTIAYDSRGIGTCTECGFRPIKAGVKHMQCLPEAMRIQRTFHACIDCGCAMTGPGETCRDCTICYTEVDKAIAYLKSIGFTAKDYQAYLNRCEMNRE